MNTHFSRPTIRAKNPAHARCARDKNFTEDTARARAEVAQFFRLRALAQRARKICARERYARVILGLHFPRNYQFQECNENSENMSQENRKKFQTAWKDFTERSLTAHTGSSGIDSFYFQMSEDLEILQKQNGNKETLRFLFYLCKLFFSENYLLH